MESLQNVFRSGEKGGPAGGWWKVESSMLGCRKACWCSDSLPGGKLIPPCQNMEKYAERYSFLEWRESILFIAHNSLKLEIRQNFLCMVGRSAVRWTASQKLAGDSWYHLVGIQESMQMFWVLLVWKEATKASGLTSVFSMFADFSLISNLCSHACLFSLIVWTIWESAPLQGLPYAVSTPCAPQGG